VASLPVRSGRRSSLSQRERAGVRENSHAVKNPLPSTGLFQ
jgi:hypothetical protein